MKKLVTFLISAFFITLLQAFESTQQVPMPDYTLSPKSPKPVTLDGTWEIDLTPTAGFEKTNYRPKEGYKPIIVPGEIVMQGYGIEHDKPVVYHKKIKIPKDYKNQMVVLRFDGVYGAAKLYVNGKFVKEHFGGFTRWQNDITPYVQAGGYADIKVEVTDRLDDISYASGYAHHPIGGILRSVKLFALPKSYIVNNVYETALDNNYKDATLKINSTVSTHGDVILKYTLYDNDKKVVATSERTLNASENTKSTDIAISNPLKWSAESPNLYTLKTEVIENGSTLYSLSDLVGFRKIEIKNNVMSVNGQPIKLRGACRHDIHPTLGRTINDELDSLDAHIFKATNMNYVRTSHYPPSEKFLEWCDKLGLYVECETAICFVDTHRQKNYAPARTQSDIKYEAWYLNQLKEMVTTLRNHSSILFWSIGNECVWGDNFEKSYKWIKAADTTRPAIFSYPGTVAKDKNGYDIVSMHYPGVNGTLDQYGIQTIGFQRGDKPSVFDEWAHVPCYTYATLQDDPNIREFWGISLDMMWSNLFEAQGGLGGAIWGYIDETFMIPQKLKHGEPFWIDFAHTAKPKDYKGDCVGYGEWGIVDVWRREKPEFWGTKKAYSPIRLSSAKIENPTSNQNIYLPIYNRYDHTNLKDIKITYTYNGKEHEVKSPDIAPHKKGMIEISAQKWRRGDKVLVKFYENDFDGGLRFVDEELISLGDDKFEFTDGSCGAAPKITENATHYIVEGTNFKVPFNKSTGLIENATSNGEVIIESAPYLNFDVNFNHFTSAESRAKAANYIATCEEWKKQSLKVTESDGVVRAQIIGTYQNTTFECTVQISSSGTMTFDYVTLGEPDGWLRESGLKFIMPDKFTSLEWNRNGYWTTYPTGDISGNNDKTELYASTVTPYGAEPKNAWSDDTHNYYYFANRGATTDNPLKVRAKAMKENITNYTLSNDKASLKVVSNGAVACRLSKPQDNQLIMHINNRWDYPEIAWGDYCKTIGASPNFGKIVIKL